MPHELSFLGISFSPFVPVVILGILTAITLFILLIRSGLIRYFANPPWVFLSLCVINICLLSWWSESL